MDGDDIGCDLVVDLAKPPYPDLGRAFDVVSCGIFWVLVFRNRHRVDDNILDND